MPLPLSGTLNYSEAQQDREAITGLWDSKSAACSYVGVKNLEREKNKKKKRDAFRGTIAS